MQAYITNIRIKGIKNIDKEISLDFYNKTLPKKFILDNSNIKSIYGENGAGKSGIIHAIDIYKKITTTRNYLLDSNTIDVLHELINKKLKSFFIEVTFIILINDEILFHLSHFIEIKEVNDHYEIIRERLSEQRKRKINEEKERIIIDVENGKITEKSNMVDKYLIDISRNLLKSRSFLEVAINEYNEDDRDHPIVLDRNQRIYIFQYVYLFMAITNIHVYVSQEDRHDKYVYSQSYSISSNMKKIIKSYPFSKSSSYINKLDGFKDYKNYVINEHTDRIHIKDKDSYLQRIQRLHEFLNIFKNNIIDIEVEMKENKDYLICEKYFVYDGYRINVEFESTGIKKFIRLFDAFEKFVNGEIVFIDELDANIHDVYLIKLLEYFTLHAKGQLCFTTHNLGPMEILRKQKHAIDFLSNDARIVPWKKNGHYSVINLYREGMIENSPFNIEPIDFVGIFEEEETNGDTIDSGCGNES